MNRCHWLLLLGLGIVLGHTTPTAALDFLVLGPDKLTRVQVQIDVNGEALPQVWDRTFAKMFAFYDRNGDGFLDAKEAAHLPTALAFRHGLNNGFVLSPGATPPWKELDSNGDNRVSGAEVAAWYRQAGVGDVFVGVGKLPASEALTDALLQHLDKEWKATAALLKLDRNDDELVGSGELVAKTIYPGTTGAMLLTAPSPADRTVADLPLLVLPSQANDTHWATVLLQKRDTNKDGVLNVHEAGLASAVFAQLDSNNNGTLTSTELVAWRKLEPGVVWRVSFGKAPVRAALSHIQPGLRLSGRMEEGKLSEGVARAKKHYQTAFTTADTNGDGLVDAEEAGVRTRRRQREEGGPLLPLLEVADRDGDGKLSAKEIESWLALQEQIAQGQVLLRLLDAGQGLFELLDTDHDGSLSLRELRGARQRVEEAGCMTAKGFQRSSLPRSLLGSISQGYPASALGSVRRSGPTWFLAMDRNGDGDVSRREFTGEAAVFNKLDLDKDGLLTPEEAEKAK